MKLRVDRAPIHVPGFRFSGVAAGLKDGGRKDVALLVGDEGTTVAGAFTTNRFAAAPVEIARGRVRSGVARAVLVNTKSANAGTGAAGLVAAERCCLEAADRLGISVDEVLPCSTGKIGEPLPLAKMRRGIRAAASALSPDGFWDAAEAIRTTDAFAKASVRRIGRGRRTLTVAGMAKGAGMIHPQMATTLVFLFTDAALPAARLDRLLRAGLSGSFNAISVDGDTSTNDTALLLASGASGVAPRPGSGDEGAIAEAVAEVFSDLAEAIVADGEGARKRVDVVVRGAASHADADRAARAVANSILVKCALGGEDPNWGRIACAVGYAGVRMRADRLAIAIGAVPVAREGAAVGARAVARAHRAMRAAEFAIEIELGVGAHEARILTSDLGVDYVRFNSEYSS